MSEFINEFNITVKVPSWEFCNVQESKDRRSTYMCDFVNGKLNERDCLIFKKRLYSHSDWIRKCDECINAAKIESEVVK